MILYPTLEYGVVGIMHAVLLFFVITVYGYTIDPMSEDLQHCSSIYPIQLRNAVDNFDKNSEDIPYYAKYGLICSINNLGCNISLDFALPPTGAVVNDYVIYYGTSDAYSAVQVDNFNLPIQLNGGLIPNKYILFNSTPPTKFFLQCKSSSNSPIFLIPQIFLYRSLPKSFEHLASIVGTISLAVFCIIFIALFRCLA